MSQLGKRLARALRRMGPLALFAWAVAEVLSACSPRHGKESTESVILARTVQARESTAAIVRYTGTVHARIESDLGFRVPGKISLRLTNPGDFVRKGQPLMRLDPQNLALEASGAAQRLKAAKADAVRAAADEARLKGLVDAGAISAAAYDSALAAARASAANVAAADASARNASLSLSYATLTADSDGVVLDVLAQPGQVVAAGTPVVRLAQHGQREAAIAVPETAVKTLIAEGDAEIYGSAQSVPAHLREVAGAADSITRTFAARYRLEMPEREAPLGATVTVNLRVSRERTIRLPLGALYDPGSGPGVWVVGANGQVEFRSVMVKSISEESIDVAPGTVSPGETVVALGAQLLRAGERVTTGQTSS